jgi:hypothetical protein
MEKIVTKEKLAEWVKENPQMYIGRALVALYNRQVDEEQSSNITKYKNGVGFSANDARVGTLGAKCYLREGKLTEKLLKPWVNTDPKTGLPRICKYAGQLNEIALAKAAAKRLKSNPIESALSTPAGAE